MYNKILGCEIFICGKLYVTYCVRSNGSVVMETYSV